MSSFDNLNGLGFSEAFEKKKQLVHLLSLRGVCMLSSRDYCLFVKENSFSPELLISDEDFACHPWGRTKLCSSCLQKGVVLGGSRTAVTNHMVQFQGKHMRTLHATLLWSSAGRRGERRNDPAVFLMDVLGNVMAHGPLKLGHPYSVFHKNLVGNTTFKWKLEGGMTRKLNIIPVAVF